MQESLVMLCDFFIVDRGKETQRENKSLSILKHVF